MYKHPLKNYINAKLLTVLLLGFSSGLPLTLIGSTLQAWFTKANIDLITIGALSLVSLPYILKFSWAPLMDHFRIPIFGRRKGWILFTQLGLIVSLFFLAQLNPQSDAYLMGAVALAIAFLSASQDISITAYQTEVLAPEARGLGAAYYVFAYRVAYLISGGFALIMADFIGWQLTYEIMAFFMFACFVISLKVAPMNDPDKSKHTLFHTMRVSFTELFLRPHMIIILLFILFYKLGDALALSLLTNFLLTGLGFSLTEVGVSYKVVSFFATILGAFTGGVVLTHVSIYYGLFWFGVAQAVSTLTFVLLSLAGKNFLLMTSAIFVENFCTGLSTAALLAFMMSLCHQQYAATQFALLSALASSARVMLGPLAAWLVTNVGWTQFFALSFVLSLPGMLLLLTLKTRLSDYAPAT